VADVGHGVVACGRLAIVSYILCTVVSHTVATLINCGGESRSTIDCTILTADVGGV
jgi:hypothetical protein